MTNLTVRYQMCGAVEGGYNMVRLILVWGVASLVNIVAERLERESGHRGLPWDLDKHGF